MPAAPDQSVAGYSTDDLTVGTGTEAVTGRNATVRYVGWLYSVSAPDGKGAQFDAGTFSFVIGAHSVIQGFEMAVNGMKVGGTRRAVIPPSLAYGTSGNPASKIGPDDTLVFDIALINVQ
jgi:FKBP-type peptidyl-prolyl cis-trans isomerase FkpA